MSCPICQKTPDKKYRPFCSRRCADVDLGRWVTGSYTIESADEPEDFSVNHRNSAPGDRDENLH